MRTIIIILRIFDKSFNNTIKIRIPKVQHPLPKQSHNPKEDEVASLIKEARGIIK